MKLWKSEFQFAHTELVLKKSELKLAKTVLKLIKSEYQLVHTELVLKKSELKLRKAVLEHSRDQPPSFGVVFFTTSVCQAFLEGNA